jgi:hypothetical protein
MHPNAINVGFHHHSNHCHDIGLEQIIIIVITTKLVLKPNFIIVITTKLVLKPNLIIIIILGLLEPIVAIVMPCDY